MIDMIDVAIISGSTRPGREGAAVARWIQDLAVERGDAWFEDKAFGFVRYGSAGSARATEHLRPVMSRLRVAHVSAQVELSLLTDSEDFTVFHPAGRHEDTPTTLPAQVIAWSAAPSPLRRGEHHGT